MRLKTFPFLTLILLLSLNAVSAAAKTKEDYAREATSADLTRSNEAIRRLRELGREGLDTLFAVYAAEIESHSATARPAAGWSRVAFALDAVARQKDSYAARLFWHTDFEEARKVARAERKPILSLRLLGNLDEEFSCANSRFFRAVLYSNAEISKYLRENYVLHWKSVRPAPRVTIDFGDGRKIERTLTGNSIHYVIDADGAVVDALPGLNSPQSFLQFLKLATVYTASNMPGMPRASDAKESNYQRYRTELYRQLRRAVNLAAARAKLKFDTTRKARRNYEEMPPALAAAPYAMAKRAVEIDILKDITPDLTRFGDDQVDLAAWKKMAAAMGERAAIDEASRAFIRRQTASNDLSDADFEKLIDNLAGYIDVDTARNQALMRPTLLVWLNKGLDRDVERLNEKVYAELFLTPNNDPWLGLYGPGVYTALDGNGIK